MQLPANAYVAVVDGAQFRLFKNKGSGQDIDLTSVDTGDISTSNKSGGARDHDASHARDGGRQLEELAHGAGVAEYLNGKVLKGTIDKLVIIADPDTLGEMRRHYHGELKSAVVGELAKTLTNSSVDDIVRSIAAA